MRTPSSSTQSTHSAQPPQQIKSLESRPASLSASESGPGPGTETGKGRRPQPPSAPVGLKKQVNNRCYNDMGEKWYEGEDHALAVLRREGACKLAYIDRILSARYPNRQPNDQGLDILDVGCGGGVLSNQWAAKGHKVYGIDLSEAALQVARRHAPRHARFAPQYACGDALNMGKTLTSLNEINEHSRPTKDSSKAWPKTFDAIMLLDLLEHVEHPEGLIKAVAPHLKPGGLLFFHTFNRTPLARIMAVHAMEWFVPDCPKNLHVYDYFITPHELDGYLQSASMTLKEWVGLRPKWESPAFWQSLWQRRLHENFCFVECSSLQVGYLGYAEA